MEDKKEKLPSTRIQCEKPIYINIDSSHWKYSLFNIEIFTFSYKRKYKYEIFMVERARKKYFKLKELREWTFYLL